LTEHRFFLGRIDPQTTEVIFPPDISHQITHVLRLVPGDQVTVLDGSGKVYQVRLNHSEGDQLSAAITHAGEIATPLPVRITLFFPLSKREKVEWILQKGTEVGVSVFQPFASARSLVQDTNLPSKKTHRWESIIREAAEQSRRGYLPVLRKPEQLSHVLSKGALEYGLDTILVATVGGEDGSLAAFLDQKIVYLPDPDIGLFVGAEGGFAEQEIAQFKKLNFPLISLGKTVLRMETAAIVFPALVLYHFESNSI